MDAFKVLFENHDMTLTAGKLVPGFREYKLMQIYVYGYRALHYNLLQVGFVSFDQSGFVLGGFPKIGGQVLVSFLEGVESSLQEVFSSLGATSSTGLNILNTGHLQDLLGGGGSDDTRTSGTGDQSDSDGTTLTGDLGGDSVGVTDLVTPISSSDGDHVQLSIDDSTLNGTLDFLGDLNTETEVTFGVTDEDDSLESGSLTSGSHLLYGLDLHDFFLELVLEESVNDLELLDGEGESVDFFDLFNETLVDESSELGNGSPFFFDGASLATLITSTTSTEASAASTASFSTSTAFSFSSLSHLCIS